MPFTERQKRIQTDASATAQRLPYLLAEAERLSASLAAGFHGRRRAGPGEAFWQYRDYTQGDPASMIDWRQSARSPRRLFVRETEWESAATIRFWCSGRQGFNIGSKGVPTKQDRAVVIALALGFALTRAGELIGTIAQPERARSGDTAVSKLGETLLADPLAGELPVAPERAVHAVFLSDFYLPTQPLIDQIRELPQSNVTCHMVEITDPAEETFPFEGHTVFDDGGGIVDKLRFGNVHSVRDAYQNQRNAHRSAVLDACRKAGITLVRHRTDQPATQALSALYRAIGPKVD